MGSLNGTNVLKDSAVMNLNITSTMTDNQMGMALHVCMVIQMMLDV